MGVRHLELLRLAAAVACVAAVSPTTFAADASPAPEASRQMRVAYIFDTDLTARNEYAAMLTADGCTVTTVSLADAGTFDFQQADVIVVGYDTGNLGSWGTPAAVANVAGAGCPVIGAGRGGDSFFQQAGLYIGADHCMGGTARILVVADGGHDVWTHPNAVAIPPDDELAVYVNGSYSHLVYMDPAPPEVSCLARAGGYPAHCGLTLESWGSRSAALWSFEEPPTEMTPEGQDVFENLLYLVSDWIFADGFEDGDTSAWSAAVP